jgi:hypothetical protein
MISQRLCCKPRLTVREIILPLPPKNFHIHFRHALVFLHKSRLDLLIEMLQKVFFPYSQGFCVMGANVFDVVDYEGTAGAGGDRGVKLGNRGEMAAWEDVAADEVVRFCVSFVSLITIISLNLPALFGVWGLGEREDLQIRGL